MKNRIFAVFLVVSVLIATTLAAHPHNYCTCADTQSVMQEATDISFAETVCSAASPHCYLQETALVHIKLYEIENPAYYMDGLTAISKRSIYVGEAECRLSVKMNI